MRGACAVLVLATLFGCAPVQPPGATSVGQPHAAPATSAHAGVAVGNTVSGGAIVSSGSQPTVVDSGPSADALAVLATIPEPLPPGERVAPSSATPAGTAGKSGSGSSRSARGSAAGTGAAGGAAGAAAGATAAGGAAAGGASGAATGAGAGAGAGAAAGVVAAGAAAGAQADSARDVVADSTATAAVEDSLIPVPSPTEPLGERPGTLARALADTTPPPPPPPPAVAPAPAKAGPDSCWRVQVAAPTEKQEAELKRSAAESVLLVPFVIDHEKQRYKVRNRDCLTREAADRLRRRAIQSGFDGTFPVVEVKK